MSKLLSFQLSEGVKHIDDGANEDWGKQPLEVALERLQGVETDDGGHQEPGVGAHW